MEPRRLLRPLDYLRIVHPDKRRYDVVVPAFAAALLTLLCFLLLAPNRILGREGLITVFTQLLQILSGFYIASLAAIATFNRPSMDEEMLGETPTLVGLTHPAAGPEKMTRRQFLSFLFGYLAFLSIALYLVGALANLVLPGLGVSLGFELHDLLGTWVRWAAVYLYLFAVANLLVTTMLGLYYMTDRIHRN